MKENGSNRRKGLKPYFVVTDDGRRIDLREDARASGRENVPASTAGQPTSVEACVIAQFERQHQNAAERARVDLQDLSARFTADESALPKARDLDGTVATASANVECELEAADALSPLWSERERRLRDLRNFARDHRLGRDARYPASKWFSVGVIAILIVLESWCNAVYFAEISEFGLLGGFARACGVACLNVLAGFVLGLFVLPWISYRALRARVLAGVGICVLVGAAIIANVALARYRDALAAGADGATTFSSLASGSFHLTLSSAVLLGAGLLGFGIALWKGWSFDDPYPGYGAADRRFREADRAYLAARDAFVARTLGYVHSIPADCRSILDKAAATVKRLDNSVVAGHRVLESYETNRRDDRTGCEVHLRRWRDENAFVRTAPVPHYFEEFPEFPALVPDQMVGEFAERAVRARESIEALEGDAHRIRAENTDRLSATSERVHRRIGDVMLSFSIDGSSGPNGTPVVTNGRTK